MGIELEPVKYYSKDLISDCFYMHLQTYTSEGLTWDQIEFGHTKEKERPWDFLVTNKSKVFQKDVVLFQYFLENGFDEESNFLDSGSSLVIVKPITEFGDDDPHDDPIVRIRINLAQTVESNLVILRLDIKLKRSIARSKFKPVAETTQETVSAVLGSLAKSGVNIETISARITTAIESLGQKLDTIAILTFPGLVKEDLFAYKMRVLTCNLNIPYYASTGLFEQDGIAQVQENFPEELLQAVLANEGLIQFKVNVERTDLCGSGRGITAKVDSYTAIVVLLPI